jgi:hypothetical protein
MHLLRLEIDVLLMFSEFTCTSSAHTDWSKRALLGCRAFDTRWIDDFVSALLMDVGDQDVDTHRRSCPGRC